MIKKFKLILFIIFVVYQTSAFSNTKEDKSFNHKYLSNYLSGIISHNNDNISESVKYFSLSKILKEKHDSKVPNNLVSLEELPGVGHKTASVVISQGFGIPAFPVDTHIHRLAKRRRLTNELLPLHERRFPFFIVSDKYLA